MAKRGKASGIRIQLIVLGTTGLLALVMAVVMAVHKPFISKEPIAVVPPPVVVEDPVVTNSRPGPVEPDAISRTNLRSLLAKLIKTHAPAEREKLMEKIRKRIDEFEPFLLEILSDEDDKLILEAIALVDELQLKSAALELKTLADAFRADVRAAAIRTFETLAPWPGEDLRKFLEYNPAFPEHPMVLEAVLEACASHDDRPVDLIIPLLGHSNERVRNAAVAAIPKLSSGKELENLCKFARSADGLDARAAARALGKTYIPSEAEDCLGDLLKKDNWMVVEAALAALSNKESRLRDVEPILTVLKDSKRSVEERIYGFIALENTGTVPVDEVEEMLPVLHPVLKLLAARCLVTAGERSGIATLIDLVGTARSDSVDSDEQDCAISGAVAVLTEVAGMDLGKDREAWREWYGALEDLPPLKLYTPAPTLW